MLEYYRPEEKSFVINEMINIFDKLYDLKQTGGPMFEQYARNAMLLIMEHPESGSTLMEIPKVLADEEFRKMKLDNCKNPVVKDFWIKEAEKAGADFVGADDMVEKIQTENWFDFDVIVATPDMMGKIGRLGRVLGPKGLMPSPKSGTVTFDIENAVKEIKAGKVEYRVEKANLIHVAIGKVSFEEEQIVENLSAMIGALLTDRPAASKGKYLKKITIASTMGPGVKIDESAF
jgi:hypothetical protein